MTEQQDEWFKYFIFGLNITEIRNAITVGEIKPNSASYTAKRILEQMYPDMDGERFGSKDFDAPKKLSMFGNPAHYPDAANIPDAVIDNEPPLFMMWKSDTAFALVRGEEPPTNESAHAVMIDGHHRLTKLYINGDDRLVNCFFIDFDEVLPYCYSGGKPLV